MTQFRKAFDALTFLNGYTVHEGNIGAYREALANVVETHGNTIRRALLIADRLMQEPSVEVLEEMAGWEYADNAFKAMRDQLLRDVDGVTQGTFSPDFRELNDYEFGDGWLISLGKKKPESDEGGGW